MNDKFIVPTFIAVAVSFVGMLWWLIAFLAAWGLFAEGIFFGIALGGLGAGILIGLAEPICHSREDGP